MTENKKILRIWPFWPQGLKYHDHYLAEAMLDDGVETLFACPTYIDKSYISYTNNALNSNENSSYLVFPLRYFSIFGKPIPFNIFNFIKKIKDFNPDIVHIFGLSNFTTYFSLICLKMGGYDGKIYFNDHSDPSEKKKGFIANFYYLFFKLLYFLVIRNNYTIVVPDNGSKNELISRYGKSIESVLKFIPLGFDEKTFNLSIASRSSDAPLVVGFAGKISPAKRIEILLEAIQDMSEKELEVHICGFAKQKNQYQESLMHKIKSSKFKNIKVYDFLKKTSELATFYGKMDLAIFPGSISITTFEANGTGCPIILYESLPGLQHRVSNGRGHLFLETNSLHKLIKNYIELKKETIKHDEIHLSSMDFSWSNIKLRYYKLYGWD